MASLIPGPGERALNAGILISRATAVLPASTLGHIFTVSGGRVIVRYLVGEVTTIIQAQACTVKVTGTPTAGTAVDWSAASASISALEVGGKLGLPAAAATGLVVGNAGGIITRQAEWVAAIGTIDITTSATNTGSVKWDLIYTPLDNGASVAAA